MALIFIFPLSSAGKTLFVNQGPKRKVNVHSMTLLVPWAFPGPKWASLGLSVECSRELGFAPGQSQDSTGLCHRISWRAS